MRRALLLIGCWACMQSSGSYLKAQEPERAPLANAVGRFFGFGYSAGYHARVENRFGLHHYAAHQNVVPQPPRGIYAATPYGGDAHGWAGYGLPYQAPMPGVVYPSAQNMGVTNQLPSMGLPAENVRPKLPAAPTPSWLKPYLKEGMPAELPGDESLLDESSPSDRRGVNRSPMQPQFQASNSQLTITAADPVPVEATRSVPQLTRRPAVSILQQ